MKIEFVGYPNCGKTFLSHYVSKRFNFTDADGFYNAKGFFRKLFFIGFGVLRLCFSKRLSPLVQMNQLIKKQKVNISKKEIRYLTKTNIEHYVVQNHFINTENVIFSEGFYNLGKTAFRFDDDGFKKYLSLIPNYLKVQLVIFVDRKDYNQKIAISKNYLFMIEKIKNIKKIIGGGCSFTTIEYKHTEESLLMFDKKFLSIIVK